MQNNVIEFMFNENQIRTVFRENEVWFVGKDVAEVLGYARPRDAIRTHCKGGAEMTLPTTGGIQKMIAIPERDVYRLVMRSKLPSAEQFEDWVVGTVLPSIRKTGGYVAGEEHAQSEEEVILLAMQMLQRKIEAMKPKAEYHDEWMTAEGSYTTTEVAKKLGITAQKLNLFLRKEGIKWRAKDLPKSGYEDWFKLIDRKYLINDEVTVKTQCRVSPNGVAKIIDLYQKKSA